MFRQFIILLVTIAFCLTACHSPVYNQTEANIADVKLDAQKERRKFDQKLKKPPALVVKDSAYVDLTPVSLEHNPSWLHNSITIYGDQLPFSYFSRLIAQGAGDQVLVKYQPELDKSIVISMKYTGTVKGALELLSTRTGYVFHTTHKQIEWQSTITKTFDIAFMPGGTSYLMGLKEGGSAAKGQTGGSGEVFGAADASVNEFSNLSGKISVWRDLESSIKSMLSSNGSVVVSESTSTVTVRDRPQNMRQIESYIKSVNKNLSKQVLVKVQILEVQLNDSYNFGIDWRVIDKVFGNTNAVIQNLAGDVMQIDQTAPGTLFQGGLTPINNKANWQITALIKALNEQGKTSVVSEPRVMCANNQVSVVRLVTQEAYVQKVENTTQASNGGANSVQSSVTPGVIVFGLTLYLLPKVIDDQIYLQLNADLSTKDALTTQSTNQNANGTAAQNNTTIQLPQVSQKHFNQRSMLKSGDTLILAGFRQLSNNTDARQFLTSQALGGKASKAQNTETIILITPTIVDRTIS